jgi:glutamine cyclotransferase
MGMCAAMVCIVALAAAAAAVAGPDGAGVAWLRAEAVRRIPFDKKTFTEGLAVDSRGRLIASAGLWGRSGLRVLDPVTGAEVMRSSNAARVFGEGVTTVAGPAGELAVQLTYQRGYAIVYNATSLQPLYRTRLPQPNGPREGWGLASGPRGELYATDGSRRVYVMRLPRDGGAGPMTLERTLHTPVSGLNELEYVNGSLLANVFMTECLVRLSPDDGRLEARVDASGLWPENPHPSLMVLNGIADAGGRLILAGKMWPHMTEVRLVPAAGPFECPQAPTTAADAVLTSILTMGGSEEDLDSLMPARAPGTGST